MISTRFNSFLMTVATLTLFGTTYGAANCGTCGSTPAVSTTNAAAVCATNGHEKAEHHPARVGTDELAQMIASNTPMTIVDARSGKYDDGRRIAGAVQLAADAKDEDIAKALPDTNATIVAYCTNTKCPASTKLAARLIALGYTKIEKYEEGIEGWVAAGKPVSEAKAAEGTTAPAAAAPVSQTTCPVMVGKIDKKIHADYQGKRVYFCCPSCVELFNASPEKYLKKLADQGVTPETVPAPKDEAKSAE